MDTTRLLTCTSCGFQCEEGDSDKTVHSCITHLNQKIVRLEDEVDTLLDIIAISAGVEAPSDIESTLTGAVNTISSIAEDKASDMKSVDKPVRALESSFKTFLGIHSRRLSESPRSLWI